MCGEPFGQATVKKILILIDEQHKTYNNKTSNEVCTTNYSLFIPTAYFKRNLAAELQKSLFANKINPITV